LTKQNQWAAAWITATLVVACGTAGSSWMAETRAPNDEEDTEPSRVGGATTEGTPADPSRFRTRVIGGEEEPQDVRKTRARGEELQGKVLGTFRNTYYDFPVESDFKGDELPLRDPRCGVISQVPRGFHDAVCVQGSGILKGGRTVSFAKRDCECAEVCPKTGQHICFDALDTQKYPWGRGALGTGITPLLTVAVDDAVIPMGSGIYIPEYDGAPTDASRSSVHDGCFVAQDRGLRVKGQHVDIFTGQSSITALWNRLVPSNHGVTVVVDSPRCGRVATPALAPSVVTPPKR
jgi:3D (Asp-Asp-Asp) domain-containing protein